MGQVYSSSSSYIIDITNCHTSGSISSTSSIVGGIAGFMYYTTISNCSNKASVYNSYSSYSYAGGIAGFMSTSTIIEDCYNTGSVSAAGNSVGGIAGYYNVSTSTRSYIRRCYNTGSVTSSYSSSAYVGGIIGYVANTFTIEDCYNTGDISGYSYVGGIAGYSQGNTSYPSYTRYITNCYNSGTVTSSYCLGGIVGNNGYLSYVYNCFNVGSLTQAGSSGYIGGIVGRNYTSSYVYYSYYGGDCTLTSGVGSNSGTSSNVSSLDTITQDAKSESWFTTSSNWNTNYTWDFNSVWIYTDDENDGLPVLQAFMSKFQLGDTYNIGGETLQGYILDGEEYARWNGNWYKVEPIRWRITPNTSQAAGYGTDEDTLAVMDKIVYFGQFSDTSLGIGDGYADNTIVNEFLTESGSGLTSIINNTQVVYNEFMSEYTANVETFGNSGISVSSQNGYVFVSSMEELNTICGSDLDVEFSDLVADMLVENGQLQLYYTRNLGDNLNNVICLNTAGDHVQRSPQEMLGVRFTIMVDEYGCV